MPKGLWLVFGIGLLVFTVAGAHCQQELAEQEEPSAEQLYEQVSILWIARTLQLSGTQIGHIIPRVQTINQQQQQLLSEADNLWPQYQQAIEQVLASWIAGITPLPASLASAQQAAANFRSQQAHLDMLIAASVQQILSELRPDQRGLVERLPEQQQRHQLMAQLAGAESLAAYIAQHLDTQRELMPDEYELVRLFEAQRLATRIVNPRAPDYEPLVGRILQLTDTVYNWSQPQYNAQYPTLVDQVSQFLNLAPVATRPISYDQLVAFVASPYTAALLQQVSSAVTEASAAGPTGLRSLADHPLPAALEKSDILALLNDLRLFPQQLAHLLPLTEQAAQVCDQAQKTVQYRYEELKPTGQQAYQLLIAGGEVPPELANAMEAVRRTQQDAHRQQRVALASVLRQLESLLVPEQNAVINWQPPADVLQADPAQRAAQQRQLAAEMIEAIRFLERMRYRDPLVYIQTRIGEVEGYLRHYVDPQSPDFSPLRSFIIDLLDRMKMVEEPDWPRVRVRLAAELLEAVGALPGRGGPQPTDQPLRWEDLYQVFTSPHTAELVGKMLAARTQ